MKDDIPIKLEKENNIKLKNYLDNEKQKDGSLTIENKNFKKVKMIIKHYSGY